MAITGIRVLHGGLGARGELLLWAERSGRAASDGVGGDDAHPFAADAEGLAALVRHLVGNELATAMRSTTGRVRLPSSADAPLPSASALGISTTPDIEPRLRSWAIATIELDTSGTLALLERVQQAGSGAVAPGVAAGSELRLLGGLARQAAAIVLRQSFAPAAHRPHAPSTGFEARWRPAPDATSRDGIHRRARALPDAACAVDTGDDANAHPSTARAERFVAALVDQLVRDPLMSHPVKPVAAADGSIHDRWLRALVSKDPTIDAPPDALDRFAAEVEAWQERLRRTELSPFRLCFRLEEPADPTDDVDVDDAGGGGGIWLLRYLVQCRADPSVLVELADAWTPTGTTARTLRRLQLHAGEHLFAPLGQAARLFEPIADSLRAKHPTSCELDTAQAHVFLAQVSPLLEQGGFGVFVPAWWRGRGGRFQLGVRAQVNTQLTGGRQRLDSLNLATLVSYDWRLAIGDAQLTKRELDQLAAQKSSLVRVRGRWVELDPEELRSALAHIERLRSDPLAPTRGRASSTATVGQLLEMSVGGGQGIDGLPVHGVDLDDAEPGADVATDIAKLLAGLARHETPLDDIAPPAGLRATLRPYQQRGYAWLAYMGQVGLGACLADDMGLGKSVQALAAIQLVWERAGTARGPSLIVCPTSVLTNWLRECERFTPELPVLVHHGPGRARGSDLRAAAQEAAIVVTSYALLARDAAHLQAVSWRTVVLDEAQNIKNPGTRHAKAARALRSPARVALTGTPIENHAGDLWSIMEYLNPGLLGSQADFRRKYLIPIQTGTFPEAVERLRTVTGPFLMRRSKSDRRVISDLPDKLESTEFCLLTTEQVALYEAIVRDAATVLGMHRSEARRSGIERRGMILATLAKLKQACNHPAQLLADNSRVAGRSGKLARLESMLEEVVESGERALVFTQFVQMGQILQRALSDAFGGEVPLLHGGVTRARRDAMVERFQSPARDAPPILVLSLKAGGSGLNLTAATHVFHFDRWWNPATEQQATDRAFRIGQTRDVQVHALVCTGTVEERIDYMLRQKRAVASGVVGDGEQWITELDDDRLMDLLALRRDSMLQSGELDDLDDREWKRASL